MADSNTTISEPDVMKVFSRDDESDNRPESLDHFLRSVRFMLPLLDAVPNMVFFIKDIEARYLLVNRSLVSRLGLKYVSQIIGQTSEVVFSNNFGSVYTAQDRSVMSERKVIGDQLELHLYPSREPGWCITNKYPVVDMQGRIIALVGISYDLQSARIGHPAYSRLADVDTFIKGNIHRHISISELTNITGISVSQLERYCKRIFHLTPRQIIQKARLEKAVELLSTDIGVTEIAMQCGYTDHSAFSRQFKSVMGVSPKQFRAIKLK